jgi:hypothetical protein
MLKFDRGDLVRFAQEKGRYIQGIVLKSSELSDTYVNVLFYNEGKELPVTLNKKAIELIQKYRSEYQ